MELTQNQANTLLQLLKEAVRADPFEWTEAVRADEEMRLVEDDRVKFVLTLNRNPFEIRLHLRARKGNIGLCRIDAAPFHLNPDGSELRDQPHMHLYKEGDGLAWATPIDWYDVQDPQGTLERFLEEVNGSFPNGIQTHLF